jgi:hypothetical protein
MINKIRKLLRLVCVSGTAQCIGMDELGVSATVDRVIGIYALH